MVSLKIGFVGFFFFLLLAIFDQLFNPIANALAILILSILAYRDLQSVCRCKHKYCTFCNDNKEYKKGVIAHLVSYPLIYFLVLLWNRVDNLYVANSCNWFVNTAYCASIENYDKIILVLMIFAIFLYLGSFVFLISETGKGEGLNITSIVYDPGRVTYLKNYDEFDSTAPDINIYSPVEREYLLNEKIIADWTATDSETGIENVRATNKKGEVVDTKTGGAKIFSIYAMDGSGNKRQRTVNYKVVYGYDGLLPPLDTVNNNAFKLGSVIPMKFRITDYYGNYISTAIAKIYLTKHEETRELCHKLNSMSQRIRSFKKFLLAKEKKEKSADKTTTNNLFRYDVVDNQYIFDLETKYLSSGSWQIRIDLDDRTSKYATIILEEE